jgi:hypothetical protein
MTAPDIVIANVCTIDTINATNIEPDINDPAAE